MRAYVHLVDGRPGYFDGEQIVFAEDATTWRDEYPICIYRESLRTIERERRLSEEFRLRHNWDVPRYGHIIIGRYRGYLPAPEHS